MDKFSSVKGISAPLINKSGNQLSLMMNIDTDMIIPKQFLKTIKRSGLGKNLFDEILIGQFFCDAHELPLEMPLP